MAYSIAVRPPGGRETWTVVDAAYRTVVPVEGVAPLPDGAGSPALEPGGGVVAVRLGAGEVAVVPTDGGPPFPVLTGTALVAPSVDRFGWVWSGERTSAGVLRAARADGTTVEVELPWLAGRTLQVVAPQPRQARRNLVVALACRRQRLLVQARQQGGLEQSLQFGNRVDLRAQLLGADAPAGPGPLHQSPPRCGRQPQNQLRPQHGLCPHHADFERGMAVHVDHQGQETFNGKVRMLQRLAPHAQLCGKHQFKRFTVVQQLLSCGRW